MKSGSYVSLSGVLRDYIGTGKRFSGEKIILKTSVYPRKTRKPRNKSIGYSGLAIHLPGDVENHYMPLKLFVFFVPFVDN